MPDIQFLSALKRRDASLRARVIGELTQHEAQCFNAHFPTWHHPGQLPPEGDWRTWLIMAGRGFGKTRAGAEWVLSLVRPSTGSGCADSVALQRAGGDLRIALVAATVDEARRIMVEGPSGLLSLARDGEVSAWLPAQRRLIFANGAEVALYSGANAESLRGPEHHYAWCDELAKWKQAEAAWDNLQLGLRMGEFPRALVTTTPRLSAVLSRIEAAPDTVKTGGATGANPHLPANFVAAMHAQYAGTRLGRQELDGQMPSDVEGSLWPEKLLAKTRISAPAGQYDRVVIGVDPPVSANGTCGIVIAGRTGDVAYVLADRSVGGASPETWARAIVRAAEDFGADRVIAEGNQGGDMIRSVLLAANPVLPLRISHAAKSKTARAEPVAALFENGRAFFAGTFQPLEEQLAGMVAGGAYEGPGLSPDRADAMVWALHELMLRARRTEPGVCLL